MNDPEMISESDFQSESWSTTTLYDAVYEKDNTENQTINVVQGDIIEEHDNVTEAEEEVYEEYDGDYEEYMPRNKNMRVVQTHQNAIEEEVYEEYDGNYQEYMPRNATYSNKPKSFTQKFLTKKILEILVLLIVCIVGIVVWLSVHFTKPTPTTTVATTTSVSVTTTVTSFKMASARGTVFSIKSNKLNV